MVSQWIRPNIKQNEFEKALFQRQDVVKIRSETSKLSLDEWATTEWFLSKASIPTEKLGYSMKLLSHSDEILKNFLKLYDQYISGLKNSTIFARCAGELTEISKLVFPELVFEIEKSNLHGQYQDLIKFRPQRGYDKLI
jgi:hypothetical protein